MSDRITLASVRAAADRLRGAIVATPFLHSHTLSRIAGAELWLKFENLQFTSSFKERGALNKLLSLDAAERKRGVVAMSAGNHAQSVAYHAGRLGVPAVIVMPRFTPFVKVTHTESYGAEVVLFGDTVNEAAGRAHEIERERNLVFVHPYDDPDVISGQGTLALEMLEGGPALDALVVPIGGGGLLAGIAVAARALQPELELYGVQSEGYPAAYAALHGATVPPPTPTIAEGIAVQSPGRHALPILRALLKDILLVKEDALERAVSLLANIEKTIVEGAGGAGLAAVLTHAPLFRGKRVGLILCGGNIDSRLLASVLMRDLVREGRLARLRIEIRDSPGALADAARIAAENGGNIVDVEHHRVFAHVNIKSANLDLAVETRDAAHMQAIVRAFERAGYVARLLDQE